MANIDKQLVKTRFARSVATYHEAAEIQRDMAETLLGQLALADLGHVGLLQVAELGGLDLHPGDLRPGLRRGYRRLGGGRQGRPAD